MASSFFMRGSLWTFRVKVRSTKGTEYVTPHALWDTKEEAAKEVDLFIWYKSRKDATDPPIPLPHGNWFKTTKPDETWDVIREHLRNRVKPAVPVKRKMSPSVRMVKRRRMIVTPDKDPENPSEKQQVDEAAPSPTKAETECGLVVGRVMKKTYSLLGDRRRSSVDASVYGGIQRCWNYIAPSQPIQQLRKCVDSIFGITKDTAAMKSSIQSSYRLAKDRKDGEFMIQLMSIFVLQKDMTKAKLEAILDDTISSRRFQHAKHHTITYGAGQPAEMIMHHRNISRRYSIVDSFVAFCLAKGVITANGRSVRIPGKDSVSVPNVKRLEGKHPLIKFFEEDERRLRGLSITATGRRQKREYISLRREDMEEIIAVVCPEIHTSMAALDVVSQLHGTNNFKILRSKLTQLEVMIPSLRDEIYQLLSVMATVEEILSNKNKFRSKDHFNCDANVNGPAEHCHYFAFGKVDPIEAVPCGTIEKMACGHYHVGSCAMCGEVENFACLLQNMSDKVFMQGHDRAKSLNLQYHRQRFNHYAGHQGRLLHESQVAFRIKKKMKDDPSLIFVTADYAMKFLPLKDSEAQSDFFGKAGINWHGICLQWYSPDEDEFRQYYVNQCVEDSAEDGISVATLLSKVR